LDTKPLEKLFQHTVLKMLLRKGEITEEMVNLTLSWRHSGFNVHCGPRIQPGDEEAMENLARYVVRASSSQERMTYLPDESQVLYRSQDGKDEKTFDALEWLAAMCSYVPNKASRWFVTVGPTVTSVGVNGRRQTRRDLCLASCRPRNHPESTARTRQELSDRFLRAR
jgi:hypothetical protein